MSTLEHIWYGKGGKPIEGLPPAQQLNEARLICTHLTFDSTRAIATELRNWAQHALAVSRVRDAETFDSMEVYYDGTNSCIFIKFTDRDFDREWSPIFSFDALPVDESKGGRWSAGRAEKALVDGLEELFEGELRAGVLASLPSGRIQLVTDTGDVYDWTLGELG